MTDARPDAPVMPLPNASARDWTEDFQHENGCYLCKCRTGCGLMFYGHKRRITCKACAQLREGSEPKAETEGLGAEPVEPAPKDAPEEGYSDKSYIADLEYEVKRLGNLLSQGAAPAEGVQPVALRCSYPDCKCPVDAPPNWCARGLPVATPQAEAARVPDDAPDQLTAAYQLGELLAIIHRDGGHYAIEHGWQKAVSDAHEILAAARDSQAPAAPAAPVDARVTRALRLAIRQLDAHRPVDDPSAAKAAKTLRAHLAALSRPQAEQEPT